MKQQLVVIGNGMAGMKVVEEILQTSTELFDITVFGEEPHGNYNRILLSMILAGEKAIDEIFINDHQWYEDNNIRLYTGSQKRIETINRTQRTVTSLDGTEAYYDRLLISTGSKPRLVDVPGADLEGVVSFRDIDDVETMLQYRQGKKRAVILGGGLLGLEAANGLNQQGLQVTVVHRTADILNRQLDPHAAHLLQLELESRGIEFEVSQQIESIQGNAQNHICGLCLSSLPLSSDSTKTHKTLPCDLLVMAVGVIPNIALAKSAGLHCQKGIVVNDTLQTYDPCIYAVGECIEHRSNTFGLVAPLFDQAKVCANHLCQHGVASYTTLPQATKLKITGILVFSAGDFMGSERSEAITLIDNHAKTYKKLVIEDNKLIGVVLYGETSDGLWFQELIEKKLAIDSFRHIIIFGERYFQKFIEDKPTHRTDVNNVSINNTSSNKTTINVNKSAA